VERFLTIEEAADIFRVSVPTMRRWVELERIPFCKCGARKPGDKSSKVRVLFRESDLEAYVEQCLNEPRTVLAVTPAAVRRRA